MEDTSRYGTVRLARRGEIGEAIAMEDIRRGDLVVGKAPEYHKPLEIVMRWEHHSYETRRPALPGCHCYGDKYAVVHNSWCRYSTSEKRGGGWKWFWIILVALFGVAFYIDNFTSLTTVEQAHAEEVQAVQATVTAYTSSEDETDSTPFENASGTRPARGSVACPRELAFGTQVVIDGKTYRCDDRMHSKYADRYDIWVESKAEAFEWGRRTLAVVIK